MERGQRVTRNKRREAVFEGQKGSHKGRAAGLKEAIGACLNRVDRGVRRDDRAARHSLGAQAARCASGSVHCSLRLRARSRFRPWAILARRWGARGRECVYEGVEKFLIPKSLSPEVYRNAIAEDRQMTAAVAGGKMTRSERRERIENLIEEIHRIEEANSTKLQQQSFEHMEGRDAPRAGHDAADVCSACLLKMRQSGRRRAA